MKYLFLLAAVLNLAGGLTYQSDLMPIVNFFMVAVMSYAAGACK